MSIAPSLDVQHLTANMFFEWVGVDAFATNKTIHMVGKRKSFQPSFTIIYTPPSMTKNNQQSFFFCVCFFHSHQSLTFQSFNGLSISNHANGK